MVLIFTFELESQFHQVKLKKNKNILLILYNKHTQYQSGTKPDKDGMRKRVGSIHISSNDLEPEGDLLLLTPNQYLSVYFQTLEEEEERHGSSGTGAAEQIESCESRFS